MRAGGAEGREPKILLITTTPLTLTTPHPHPSPISPPSLGDTLLENEGVSLICTALSHTAPYLEELDLSLNELTAEGAVAVARCIMGKPGITKLNLR